MRLLIIMACAFGACAKEISPNAPSRLWASIPHPDGEERPEQYVVNLRLAREGNNPLFTHERQGDRLLPTGQQAEIMRWRPAQ